MILTMIKVLLSPWLVLWMQLQALFVDMPMWVFRHLGGNYTLEALVIVYQYIIISTFWGMLIGYFVGMSFVVVKWIFTRSEKTNRDHVTGQVTNSGGTALEEHNQESIDDLPESPTQSDDCSIEDVRIDTPGSPILTPHSSINASIMLSPVTSTTTTAFGRDSDITDIKKRMR